MAWGGLKDKEVQVKRMNNKKARDIIVVTHPKRDVSMTREYKKEDVQTEEKICNITPFVPLSTRLNQHASKQDWVEQRKYLHKCGLPVQWKASQ